MDESFSLDAVMRRDILTIDVYNICTGQDRCRESKVHFRLRYIHVYLSNVFQACMNNLQHHPLVIDDDDDVQMAIES